MINKQPTGEDALKLASELVAILNKHDERNWSRGIRSLQIILRKPNSLQEASALYRGMFAGSGSFSDFYLHADSVEERRCMNEPLDRLRSQLWIALNC